MQLTALMSCQILSDPDQDIPWKLPPASMPESYLLQFSHPALTPNNISSLLHPTPPSTLPLPTLLDQASARATH